MNITSKTSKAQLVAYIAALEARLADEACNFNQLLREHEELRAQHLAAETHSAITIVETRGALLAHLKHLAKTGVPCRMQGNEIKHGVTKEVIAQVRA